MVQLIPTETVLCCRVVEITHHLRDTPATYLKIQASQAPNKPAIVLDEITTRSYLDSALGQYLGLTGMALSIDIMKVSGTSAWLKVPTSDENLVIAALAQWTSSGNVVLRSMGRSTWLGGLTVDEHNEMKLWSLED